MRGTDTFQSPWLYELSWNIGKYFAFFSYAVWQIVTSVTGLLLFTGKLWGIRQPVTTALKNVVFPCAIEDIFPVFEKIYVDCRVSKIVILWFTTRVPQEYKNYETSNQREEGQLFLRHSQHSNPGLFEENLSEGVISSQILILHVSRRCNARSLTWTKGAYVRIKFRSPLHQKGVQTPAPAQLWSN